jgi:hypothetical protein
MILNENLEILYEKTYSNDMFIIDYELTYNASLLVMLIEDNLTLTRELAVIEYKTDECIQPPSLNFNHLFSVRGIFNTHLLVASRDAIYSF